MDGEEDEDEDDDIEDSVNQTTEADTSGAPEGEMQVDREDDGSEGQEDKENFSFASHNTDISSHSAE